MTYVLNDYVAMVSDERRTGAYVRALQCLVRPDSVVLDLGTGFGFFAVLAARLGAKHVYAVDPNDAISLGPELARDNGVSDRVTFFHADSRDISLPERANVLVEDVRGVLPYHADRVRLLCDARHRLLTPNARVVAERDHLFAAPVRARPDWSNDRRVLQDGAFGVSLEAIARRTADAWRRGRIAPDQVLFGAESIGSIELATVQSPNFEGIAAWTVPAAARIDGFTVWFDAELAGGERFSTAPGPAQAVHGSSYFPLREPIEVLPGDGLRFRFVGIQGGSDYTWIWECGCRRGADAAWTPGPRQSSIGATLLASRRLASQSQEHVPTLGEGGYRLQRATALIDGIRESREIAAALAATAACGFRDKDQAFAWLVRVLRNLEVGDRPQSETEPSGID